jgi:hypothetical protein
MINKTKSWTLLLVFSLSLVPFSVGQAEFPDRTFEEARSLLYLGDAFLEDEANLDTAVYFPELMAPAPGIQRAEGAEEVMNRMIHAAKQERNDLDANCRQLTRRYQTAGDQEAVRKLNAYCDSERQRLTNRIGFLHKLRGDRRKLFTRWWHSIKRSSANLWRRIGPLGRNILRKLGDEAFNTVVQGGSLGGGVARDILKRALTSTGRGMIKDAAQRMVLQGMQKLVEGQVQIARAAGVLEDGEAADDGAGDEPEMENTEPTISFTGQRNFVCTETGEEIPIEVSFDTGDFFGEASIPFVDAMDYSQTATYVYEGNVSSDGILVGQMSVTTTVNNVDVGYITYTMALAGIVLDDGRGIVVEIIDESNTERLKLFEEGRDAVLRDPYFQQDPTCR